MSTILIVEDDHAIARALSLNLKARGYEVLSATHGCQALRLAADHSVDLIFLDLGLPDMDGLDVIDGIRGWSDIPIIVVSARHEAESKIEALDRGADDFVTKPFSLGELLARLRAALRRSSPREIEPIISMDNPPVVIDLVNKTVTRDGNDVHLTPNEWKIVELLVRNRGALVSHTEILSKIWGPHYAKETNYLRVYMSQIRQKLEVDSARPLHFLTELGMGYRFVDDQDLTR